MPQSRVLNVASSRDINAPAEKVWAVIGDFNSLPQWHPAIAASRLVTEGGATWRRVTLVDGSELSERLDSHSDSERTYSYAIPEGPLPIRDYHSRIAVKEAGAGRCLVEWSAHFVAFGVPDSVAEAEILGIYLAGLDALTQTFPG